MTTSSYNSDLLSWLKLFWTNDQPLTYDSISDAFFLNEVFREIDSNAASNDQLTTLDGMMERVKNWETLLKNIRVYYAEVLQQAIVVRLPSIVVICRAHNIKNLQKEIDKTIFLILGAAVQCEKKEYFIQDIITRLPDPSIQHGLMGFIKQVTENMDMVINYLNLSEFSTADLVFHLRNILEHREDNFVEDNKCLLFEIYDLQKQITDQKNQMQVLRNVGVDNGVITANLQSNKGIAVELAEFKAKLRKIQNELDEKNDLLADLRNELDLQQEENTKLKEVQMKLINESRRARLLQDELDSNREAIIRLPVIESENMKLKEKVNELEYYKARCEELREDLAIISNENTNLMDKIDNNTKQVEQSMKFESEYRKASRKIEELEKIRSDQNSEIRKLGNELRSLQEKDVVNLSNKSELSNKLKELQKNDDDKPAMSSISDQMVDKTNALLLRLEIENRSLKEKLTEGNKVESLKFQERISELEIENERILSKVSRLQEANKVEIQKFMEAEEGRQIVLREKNQLELNIKSAKESECMKMKELLQENENLSETILIIRERSEKSNDLRLNELEKENSKLHSSINECTHKVSNLEFDLQRSIQKCTRLDQSLEKAQQEYLLLSKQNGELNKEVASLKPFKNRLEDLQDRFSNLEVEKLRLEALAAEYCQQLKQTAAVSDDKSEEYMQQLANENQRKTSQLFKKISELESELLKTRTEIDKCNRQSNSNDKKNKSLLQEIETYKQELSSMSRLESKLKLAEKNSEELEKERELLQNSVFKLEEGVKKVDKDNRKLKNQSEVQNSSLEHYKSQLIDLEKKLHILELKEVDKDELETVKSSLENSQKRLLDCEQKNRELFLQTKEEKRQCSTLREELLNERLETQSLRNQLQKLTEEFDKLDCIEEEVKTEKLKQLESKVNTTVDDAIKKREEKNKTLQTKVATLNIREKELLQKLKESNEKYHTLQQKYEEELNLRLLRNNTIQNSKEIPPYAQYLLELKDDIVKLERQNAHHDSEKIFLNQQCKDLQEKLSAVELKFAKDLNKLQKRFDDVNSENMKLHIEESTLKSQLDTLRSDNKNLANQVVILEKNLSSYADDRTDLEKLKIDLESQCERLQKLNDQLSVEYDNVKTELDRQTTQNKGLKTELHSKSDQLEKMKKSYDNVKHLQDSLENEKNNLADGARQLINLRMENTNVNEEYNELMKKHYKLEAEMIAVLQENKVLKSESNKEKAVINRLKDTISIMEKTINGLQMKIAKLDGRVESLFEQNEQLKIENNTLLHQMKSMLMQNQELLTETLENRQSHFTEEISLRNRLNQLQRHKERLEEKIMEQYKTIPSPKKPKGGRNKFIKKAKEVFKRRNSRTSIDQDRKSSMDGITGPQRSRSCVTIMGDDMDSVRTGDRSSDYHNGDSEASDRNVPDSESDVSEIDFSGPIPKVKSSRLSDVDNNSILSSVSQRVHINQLIPGSMSIYDRDESEKNRTSELNAFFLDLHNQTIEREKREADRKVKDVRSQHNGSSSVQNVVNVSNVVRGHRQPPSNLESGTQPRRQLPNHSISLQGHISVPQSALTFGNISSKQITPQNSIESNLLSRDNSLTILPTKNPVDQNQPKTPTRKASLPVTDRVEEEFSDIDNPNDFPQYRPGDNSRRQSNPIRSQSTVPASASSKEILQRLQRNAGRTTPVSNELRTKVRTQTSSDSAKLSLNNNFNSQNNSEMINTRSSTKSRPSSSMSASSQMSKSNLRKVPTVPERGSSSSQFVTPSLNKPESCPVPPVRKESGRPRSTVDNNSSKSESSEHSKPKIFYEYGHM